MPAPPSTKQKAANAASMAASKTGGGAGTSRSSGPQSRGPAKSAPSKTGSGAIGSKGGGASTQKPGAGGNAGQVTAKSLGTAKTTQQQARTTALGKVSQAAKSNAKSGTATAWGGKSFGSSLTAPNGSYYGPKGGTALNQDARLAAARSVGFSQPAISRTPGDAAMLGRMMMAESGSIRNALGGVNTTGLQGVADVVRNRVLSNQFPSTVPGVLGQRKQFSPIADGSFARTPANHMATSVAEAVLSGEQPPVVGNALNYANLHTVNTLPGYSSSATKRAFNSMNPTAMVADARNPVTRSHTFGTIGTSDVAFGGPGAYSPGTQVATLASPPVTDPVREMRNKQAMDVLTAPLRSPAAPVPQARPFNMGEWQGPVRNAAPLSGIPSPDSMGALPRNPASGMSFTPGLPSRQIAPPGLSQAPYSVNQTAPGYAGYGAFNPPQYTAGLERNAFDTARAGQYTGYGSFTPPDRTAGLSQNAYDGPRPGQYSGYGEFTAPMQSRVATDPRVAATPLGRLPAAPERPRIVAQAETRTPPPMGGALPPQIGTALGVWSTTRPIRAEPHPGTIHSQTATLDDGQQEGWGSWLKNKTGIDPVQVATQAQEGIKSVQEAAKPYEKQIAFMDKVFGPGWALGGTAAQTAKKGGGADIQRMPLPMPEQPVQTAQAEPQMNAAELTALLDQMKAKGATPEEIAFVQSLIAQSSQVA